MVIFRHQKVFRTFAKFLAVIALVLLAPCSRCEAGEVEATLNRESVAAGEGAIMTLEVKGRAGRPDMPEVENLIIQARGQSQKIQTFNGVMTRSMSYTFVVGSHVPGDYQIPAIELTVDGTRISTRPLSLKVLDAGGGGTPPAGGQEEAEPEDPKHQFGFLTVELVNDSRKHAYVGEIAPVTIRAWIPAQARGNLRSSIQPEGKGFTLHNLSEHPERSEATRNGKSYSVFTWFGGISATKAGTLPASLSVNATLAVPDPSVPKPNRRRAHDPFDDPFFDSMFDRTPMVQKDVTLKSDDQEIEVRPLPLEGRPEGFNGAVGAFRFDGVDLPSSWRTGEPGQITTRVAGTGNFALMKAPDVVPAESWKTYSGKEEFTKNDKTAFSGSKIFQFSAVPKKGGDQEVTLSLSYFDPEVGEYKTITSGDSKIQVDGQDVASDEPAVAEAPSQPVANTGGLVAQHTGLSPASTLVPLVSRFAFAEMLGASAAMSLAGGCIALFRIRREDPRRRAANALAKATQESLDAAGRAQDVAGFFTSARLTLQQRLGEIWKQPAHAITTAEVRARIETDSPVISFFEEADRFEYGGSGSSQILPEWRALLENALNSLNSSVR